MKFRITYPNGKREVISTTAETIADQINTTFGVDEDAAKEMGVSVTFAEDDDELGSDDDVRHVANVEAVNPEGGEPDKTLPPADAAATHNATTTHGKVDGELVEASPTAGEENSLDLKPQTAVATSGAAPAIDTTAPVGTEVAPAPAATTKVTKTSNRKASTSTVAEGTVVNPFAKS